MTASIRRILRVITLGVLIPGCGKDAREYELDQASFGITTLQMIQDESKIILPKEARGLNFHYKPPIDPAFAAKIEIPIGAREDMLRRLLEIKNEQINIVGELGPTNHWWVPKGAKILVNRQTSTDGVYLRVILTAEGAKTILYIEHAVF